MKNKDLVLFGTDDMVVFHLFDVRVVATEVMEQFIEGVLEMEGKVWEEFAI